MSSVAGFKPISGVRSGADRWALLGDVWLFCFFPTFVWLHARQAHGLGDRVLVVAFMLAWLLNVPVVVRRHLVRRRWKVGDWGVVLVDPGPDRRRVRAELRRSLGIDWSRARRATRSPGALILRDVESVQAHVLGARLTLAGADARVVRREAGV